MRCTVKVMLAAIALAGAPVAASLPAAAEVSISVDPNGIAFGYNDGYWDRDHHWHAWRNRREAEWYRDHYRDHYFAWRHDRDRDQGWRDADRWWEHR